MTIYDLLKGHEKSETIEILFIECRALRRRLEKCLCTCFGVINVQKCLRISGFVSAFHQSYPAARVRIPSTPILIFDTWIDTIICENNENKIKTKRPFLNLYGNCHTYFERSVNMFSRCPFCFSNLGIKNCIYLWCVCLNILPNFCRWMDPTSESGPDK